MPIVDFITKFINPWHMVILAAAAVLIHLYKASNPPPHNGTFRYFGNRGKAISWAALSLAYLSLVVFDAPLEVSQAVFRTVMFFFVVTEIIYNWGVVKAIVGNFGRWIASKAPLQ